MTDIWEKQQPSNVHHSKVYFFWTYRCLSVGPINLGAFLRCHRAGVIDSTFRDESRYWLCAVSVSVWVFQSDRESVSVIETEPVGSVIYSLFRSSFPRVHSSLPSTRRRRARPFLASPLWSNLSSLRKGKGCLCLSQQVQRHPVNINSLWCAFFLKLWFILRIVFCLSFLIFLWCMYLVEKAFDSFFK